MIFMHMMMTMMMMIGKGGKEEEVKSGGNILRWSQFIWLGFNIWGKVKDSNLVYSGTKAVINQQDIVFMMCM